MGQFLIVNGDDYGFSEAYNYGTVHAYEHGILSTASLMSNMDAATHAVALAQQHGLHLCQHTNFVQGRCCADPASIPSIVKPDGSFYSSKYYKPDGWAKTQGGSIVADKEDVKRETRAQLERHKTLAGKYPIQMEGHSIAQPSISEGLCEVAEEYGIRCMRFDQASQAGYRDAVEAFSYKEMQDIGQNYMRDGLSVEALLQILEVVKASKNEISILRFHPGWVDSTIMDSSTLVLQRCRDVEALCDKRVKEWIKANKIELLTFEDLLK